MPGKKWGSGQVAAQAAGSGFGRRVGTSACISSPFAHVRRVGRPGGRAMGPSSGSAGVGPQALPGGGRAWKTGHTGRTPLCRNPISALRVKPATWTASGEGDFPLRSWRHSCPAPSLFECPQALGPCPRRNQVNSWSFSTWSFASCPQSLNSRKQMAAAWETLTWPPRQLRAEVAVAVPLAH